MLALNSHHIPNTADCLFWQGEAWELETPIANALPRLLRYYEQPTLLINRDSISQQVALFNQCLPGVTPHFAVKANPHPGVLQHLDSLGVHFEIASQAELDLLLDQKIEPSKIIFSNPIKPRSHIAYAAQKGIHWFAVDSAQEVHKVADHAPQAEVYIRLHTSNKGSAWPLAGKFGANQNDIKSIMEAARERRINIAGLTFHVGSQCTNVNNWIRALRFCREVFHTLKNNNFNLKMLDMGGGFPVLQQPDTPRLQQVAQLINRELDKLKKSLGETGKSLNIIAEPGRFLVANSGTLICQVIGINHRQLSSADSIQSDLFHHQQIQHWLHLDAGFYSGLLELKDGLVFPILSHKHGKNIPWQLAGPTCDSIDVFGQDIQLPKDLAEGDFLFFNCTGAYVNACACEFNGFPTPQVLVV